MNASSTAPAASRDFKIQIVVPVYNEGQGVVRLYDNLLAAGVTFDQIKFVYDFDADTSVPFINQLNERDARVIGDKNLYGRGAVNALRWGFAHSVSGPVITVMGDGSDKLSDIPKMVDLWTKGATIVSASRYTRGGVQQGGGVVKSSMSRLAGLSLSFLGFPTSDATNNFKLYDGTWLSKQKVESVGGFEVAIELCFKCYKDGKDIVEIPTEWRDRTDGKSNFKLIAWTPKYLKWYLKILGYKFLGIK